MVPFSRLIFLCFTLFLFLGMADRDPEKIEPAGILHGYTADLHSGLPALNGSGGIRWVPDIPPFKIKAGWYAETWQLRETACAVNVNCILHNCTRISLEILEQVRENTGFLLHSCLDEGAPYIS